MSRAWGRVPALVLAMVAVVGLPGCATIPRTGPVISGDVINDDPLEGVFQLAPEGPKTGQSPVEVVRGFLAASAGYSDDHAVARSFLSPARRLAWRPDTSVTVFRSLDTLSTRQLPEGDDSKATPSAAPSATAGADAGAAGAAGAAPGREVAEVVVRAPSIAHIDSSGRYQVIPPGSKTEPRYFGLVKSGGQWRINTLDDGILITRNDFNVTFKPYWVYFPDAGGDYLVPDTHWFASAPGSPELPTALVRALLEGPPDWLADAVATSVPPGTEMAVSAVVVSNGIATVDLTRNARLADDRQRQLMLAQLQTTLGQLRTISSVRITVERVSYNIPSESGPRPVVDPAVGGAAVGIDAKGRVVRIGVEGNEVVKGLEDLDSLNAVYGLTFPGVSYDGGWFAALSADRSRLLFSEADSGKTTQLPGSGFTAPSFDTRGWLWTADASGVRAVDVAQAASDDGRVLVEADWLKDYQVKALRVSRDGTRAALAITDRGEPHVFLTGIVRDESGRPVRLTQPEGIVPDLVSVRDVAWVDEKHLAVLGRRLPSAANANDETVSAGVDRPWIVEIGGTIQPIEVVAGAETITVGDGASTLIVGTEKGTQGRSRPSWAKISSARWPSFPG
ncbi:MtrAB system accessory lipoprotein LpqB [Kineosporia mesophila]|uniref:MtrAB system accessory lipoprotein LpqB n=1 Tax=Kineosporia mesophila TaxID=566012 RepID=A0ABP6YUR5_9ACTN|nr:LpqB family beta-propeller domain-containing protein [Kineosporia mesophila]